MRNAFASELTALAEENPNVVLLSGDIGNKLFDKYKSKFADRFFNCGVAEANMTGVAAGMATCGLQPVTYTITPFNTTRCLEQIRVDVCYNNVPVIIVGVGAGLSYAGLGGTHHACEDISFLRSLPNMHVVCPGDAMEVRAALRAALELKKPLYLRLGKKNEPIIHQEAPEFIIGKGMVIREGNQVCLISTGNILPVVVEAADLLEQQGISTKVVNMHTVKPLDESILEQIFSQFPLVATVEEHSLIGGLGSAIAEWLVDHHLVTTPLLRFGTKDQFLHATGNQDNGRFMVGLVPGNIVERIIKNIA